MCYVHRLHALRWTQQFWRMEPCNRYQDNISWRLDGSRNEAQPCIKQPNTKAASGGAMRTPAKQCCIKARPGSYRFGNASLLAMLRQSIWGSDLQFFSSLKH